MKHSFLTAAFPIPDASINAIEICLDAMGNPASAEIRTALQDRGVHFVSLSVLPGDYARNHFLLLEASGDGSQSEVLNVVVDALQDQLLEVFSLAGHNPVVSSLRQYVRRHSHVPGLGLFATSGLCFSGTPGMSVKRILRESEFSKVVRKTLEHDVVSGTPIERLLEVRERIAQAGNFDDMLDVEPAPMLAPAPQESVSIVTLVARGVLKFTWPLLVIVAMVGVSTLLGVYQVAGLWTAITSAALVLSVATLFVVAMLGMLYARLRFLEANDVPDNSHLDPDQLAENISREDQIAQNHLVGATTVKPGLVRRLSLRIVFWVIANVSLPTSRPGFLGDIGTIHFARWVLIPGTDQLLFFSNYGGSWESYLEDFITKANAGLTGVWSNTVGFPKTKNLFTEGATDGDRFKRWARRYQVPSRFWYSAYPDLTTSRIRLNSAIRHGLAAASTPNEAQAWISCFGSAPNSVDTVDAANIQSLLFGGLGSLTSARCLMIELPDKREHARQWLRSVAQQISFGDSRHEKRALQLAFTCSGLERLGCDDQITRTFPLPFQQGMASEKRANILGDRDQDAPPHWQWGNAENPVDAVLLFYCASSSGLETDISKQVKVLKKTGGRVVHEVRFDKLDPDKPAREPFGFVDGISQPIIRGTRPYFKKPNSLHAVDAGEFVLGYRDNRGFVPHSPAVPATKDPRNRLPTLNDEQGHLPTTRFTANAPNHVRDLGKNGTFLVARQLAQDVDGFNTFVAQAAKSLRGVHDELQGYTVKQLEKWIAAKMVGRWKDGSPLVRFPNQPASGWRGSVAKDLDNEFLLGKEDPGGLKCPFGSHIRRANPRESFVPGSNEQLSITNRHRILRRGRNYSANHGDKPDQKEVGLFFVCLNSDIERQFEFIQQTWVFSKTFHGLDGEEDPLIGRGEHASRMTIPTENGPVFVTGIKDFVQVRGGAYFFLPGRAAIDYLSHEP